MIPLLSFVLLNKTLNMNEGDRPSQVGSQNIEFWCFCHVRSRADAIGGTYNVQSITENDVMCITFVIVWVTAVHVDHYPFCFKIFDDLYGVDFNGPHPSEEYDGPISSNGTSSVEVPQTEMPITAEADQQLRTLNPLRDSEVCGVDIYAEVLQILS